MASLLEHFEVEIDAPAYFPGALVKGHVRLQTNKSVLCSSVSLDARGEARCKIDLQPPVTRKYYRRQTTLYGGTYRTEKAQWKSGELRFASKAVPDGGTLHVPISKLDKKLLLHLVGHSGDEEHILGTCRLYPFSLIDNCRSKEQMDIPLTSENTLVTAVVRCKASWQLTSSGDCQLLPLHGLSELSRVVTFDIASVYLKDMPDRNGIPFDGYQCKICVESTDVADEGNQIEIPPVHLEIPFTLKLPEELPTSLDTEEGSFVRYSISCALEGTSSPLPPAVSHFGVIQPIPSSIPVLATARKIETTRKKWTFCGGRDTAVKMTTKIDRSGYSPGEPVHLQVAGENPFTVPLDLRVDLIRVHRLLAVEKESSFSTEFNIMPPVRVEARSPFLFDWMLPFPVVAPTYSEERENESDPLTWHYLLAVTAEARNRVVQIHQATVVAAALPTEAFSESKGDRIHHSRIDSVSVPPDQTRVVLGDWRESVAEGIDGAMHWKLDSLMEANRAVNKVVRRGRIVQAPFVPVYSSAKAVVSTAQTMIREY